MHRRSTDVDLALLIAASVFVTLAALRSASPLLPSLAASAGWGYVAYLLLTR